MFRGFLKKKKNLLKVYEKIIKNIKIIKKILIYLNFEVDNETKVVSANIIGGLGNQLFQMANVFSYAWKYSLTPQIKKIKESPSILKARPIYWNTIFRKIPLVKRLPFKLIVFKEKEHSYHKIPSPDNFTSIQNKNGIIFYGYFPSALYFDEFRDRLIPLLFYIDHSEKKYLEKKFPKIFNRKLITISVHIRRGDYINLNYLDFFTKLWETDYYFKSISYFQEKFDFEKPLFVIFSDDPIWSRNYITNKFPTLNLIFPCEKDYMELYLMSCCQHQIIANSSFSWWAAYFNNFPEKIIISPIKWFGSKGPSRWDTTYMNGWIKL